MINKSIMIIICICITAFLKLNPVHAEDQVIINSDPGGRLIQAAMYPIYVMFLKGGDTDNQQDNWIDKDYWASLDILEGPDLSACSFQTISAPYNGVLSLSSKVDGVL